MSETTSSKIKYVSTKKFICVEYPGYIKDVDKMLKTLGGEEKLSNTYFNTKRRLEIQFRPDDVYCHSVCGDLQPSRAMILKVKRKRRKKKQDETSEHGWEYEQEILGIVHQTYKFTSLMDYQYLTPATLQNSFSSVMTSNLLEEKQPLHIIPPIFARLDTQGNYNYLSEVVSKAGTKGRPNQSIEAEEDVPIEHTDTKIRKRRPSEAMGAIFSSKDVPKEPATKCKESVNELCRNFSWAQDAVSDLQALFDQRPIWSRSALVSHLQKDIKRERLSKILPFLAFYWLNGPWRALWNRYGYDPRQSAEGKRYQICDFRIRERKDGRQIPISRFSSTDTVTFPVQTQRNRMSSAACVDCNTAPPEVKTSSVDPLNLSYTFHADKLPHARQIMYQLCDIYDEDVQKIVSENDGRENKCRERDGWFPPDVIPRIRACMTKKVETRIEKELEMKDDREDLNQNKDVSMSTMDDFDEKDEEFFHEDDSKMANYEDD